MTYSKGGSVWNGQVNNDHLESKVAVRLDAFDRLGEPRPIRVLDAFHGDGIVWDAVEAQLPAGWTVSLFRADKAKGKAGTLQADNVRLLQALDLSRFDLIDLDSYGWPAAQLQVVAARAPDKLVLTTTVAKVIAGRYPRIITDELGFHYPKNKTAYTLVAALAEELWEAWLYQLGYRESRMIRHVHRETTTVKRYELLIPGSLLVAP